MHGYLIAIGRTNARLFYRGGVIFNCDPWTYDPAEAAWFCSEEVARTAAETLKRWRDTHVRERAIEYHHLTDREITGSTWRPDGRQPRAADDPEPSET